MGSASSCAQIISVNSSQITEHEYGSTDNEALVKFVFHIRRKRGYYLQTVLPNLFLLVAIGWLSFFVDRAAGKPQHTRRHTVPPLPPFLRTPHIPPLRETSQRQRESP